MFFFNGYVFLREEGASLVAQMVKNLPTVPETQVRSLGWEDPLEEEMATHSSTLAWKIPWTEEPGRLHEVTKSDMTEWLSHFWGDSPKEGHPFENEFPYWLCCGAVCMRMLQPNVKYTNHNKNVLITLRGRHLYKIQLLNFKGTWG